MENKKKQIIAKTFNGLEQVLAKELIELGAEDVEIKRRAVSFFGDKSLLYKVNLRCRTAVRFIVPILTFEAFDADDIYEKVKAIDWEQYLTPQKTFAIDTTVYSDVFTHSKFVAYRTKDAIADQFVEKFGKRPSVSLTNPDLMINVHIDHTICNLCLDSSGESLHKRGYRVEQTEAPINEVLAAGMLKIAGWDGQCDFIDPMCGSGTLLIEAALMALNIPPGIFRKSFAFEKWNDFDKDLFDELYNDDSCERKFIYKIYGSDISRVVIDIAEKNVKSAGVGKYIDLKPCDINDIELPESNKMLMVSNPPYGERLRYSDMENLYGDIGRMLKRKFAGNTAWLISSNEDLLTCIGMKPSQKIALSNAELECQFCEYEIFEGRRNDFMRNRYGERKADSLFENKKVELENNDDAKEFSNFLRKKDRFSQKIVDYGFNKSTKGHHFRDVEDKGNERKSGFERFKHRSSDRNDRRGVEREGYRGNRDADNNSYNRYSKYSRNDSDRTFNDVKDFDSEKTSRDKLERHFRENIHSRSSRPFRTGIDNSYKDNSNEFEDEKIKGYHVHDSRRQRNSNYPFRRRRDEGNKEDK